MQSVSILLVEDEALVRLLLVEMLEELGHRVAAEASSIDQAKRIAETATFDLAILDLNIAGRNIVPVAEIVHRRGKPFIFLTGYASSALPNGFADRPHLQKPCTLNKLQKVLNSVLAE